MAGPSSSSENPLPPTPAPLPAAARAALVNRTHRVVRERARSQFARQSRIRSLWIPLAVCSALLLIISTGVWTVLAQNELTPNSLPDSSEQMLVFLLWFFPVSAALLALVWSMRAPARSGVRPTS